MKKLLVLVLVLGMASAANAAISFYIDGSPAPSAITVAQGATVTIQIYSSALGNWGAYGIQRDTGSSSTEVGLLGSGYTYQGTDTGPDGGNAGEGGSNVWYTEADWSKSGYQFVSQTIAGAIVIGIQHEMVYTAPESDGTTAIGLFSPPNYTWDVDELDRINITVPEPMTIALLGLGGLFLRRRR